MDRLGERVMEVCRVPQYVMRAPHDHGVILIHVVLQRVACEGDAPLGLQTCDSCKSLGGWVLDLMTLISNHHSSLTDERLKGFACSNSLRPNRRQSRCMPFFRRNAFFQA